MNIIELLEYCHLDTSKINSLTVADYIQIENQLFQAKVSNTEIEETLIKDLLRALKKYKEELSFVVNNPILYNLFTQKNHPKDSFQQLSITPSDEKIKSFIALFLTDDLTFFFNQNLEHNNFKEISHVLEAHRYLPKTLLSDLREQVLEKLQNCQEILAPPYGNFSKILFLKEGSFYLFLNQIKNEAIENILKDVIALLSNIYKQDSGSELATKSFIALNNYKAVDQDLILLINKNKYSSEVSSTPFFTKKMKLYLAFSVVIVLASIRIILFLSIVKPFRNFDTSTDENAIEYHDEPRKIDRYYTQMKFQIDSFFVFLADYNPKEIKQLTMIDTVKTGHNPFESFYQSTSTGETNNFIRVKNNTASDMILLENATVYDTIKLPKAAYYMKSGTTIEVNKKDTEAKSVFNIYLGNKLATFQTNSNHLFIRNHSVVEYRFSELAPYAKDILKKNYSFAKDVSISIKNGNLKIN